MHIRNPNFQYICGSLGKQDTLPKIHVFKQMESNNISISNTVYCIQIFPLEAKLQESKEGTYQKIIIHIKQHFIKVV